MLKQEDFLRKVVEVLEMCEDGRMTKGEVEMQVISDLKDQITPDLAHWMGRAEKSKVSRLRQTIAFSRELAKTRNIMVVTGERGIWQLSPEYLAGEVSLDSRPERATVVRTNRDQEIAAFLAA